MPPKVEPPFNHRKDVYGRPWWLTLLRPSGIGTLTAALFALSGRELGVVTPVAPDLGAWPARVLTVLLGFALGYCLVLLVIWLRWNVVRLLLRYSGWVTHPRSLTTKIWGITLKYLIGKGPHSTMKFQSLLPRQPLPGLNQTLDLWIEVSRQFLTEDEHKDTVQAVEKFRLNEGPQLQQYLEKRAAEKPSWLYEYWMYAAYLMSRKPLVVNSNYYLTNKLSSHRKVKGLSRAAYNIRRKLEFYAMIRDNTLPPMTLMELVPLCMHGYEGIFNSVRLPGEHVDTMITHPGNEYFIFIRNGHYFKIDVMPYDKDTGRRRLLTVDEIYNHISYCIQVADALPCPPPVAALTSQNRTLWAGQREKLKTKNRAVLDLVEKCIFVSTFDSYEPVDQRDCTLRALTGNINDRWFDKGVTLCTFGNAYNSMNVEHSSIDAMVFTTCSEYAMLGEQYTPAGDHVPDPKHRPRTLDRPARLEWDLDYMKEEIDAAVRNLTEIKASVDMYILVSPYGKRVPKKARLSPDGYFQMGMQLAYMRMHGVTPKTYEPSTGRLFLRGRTETVHPTSTYSRQFVKAMDDPSASKEEKLDLLRKAVKHQNNFRLKATVGQGCDRHLLGLLCASRELGMDIPEIFKDKAFQMPYPLSTSQTPNHVAEYGIDVDLTECAGGFGPSTPDGYGISYGVLGDDVHIYHISSWKTSEVADCHKFGAAIRQALTDMQALL